MTSGSVSGHHIHWAHKQFSKLTLDELYAMLALRQQVFVVEQNCPYQDADGEDQQALHLLAWQDECLVGYARIFHATGQPNLEKRSLHGADSDVHRIGRLIIAPQARGLQLGRTLMVRAMELALADPNSDQIVIGAQTYLLDFYRSLGFAAVGETYLEDEIPHQDMCYQHDPVTGDISPAATPQLTQHEGFSLEPSADGLQLRWLDQPKVSPLRLDFVAGAQSWRRQAGGIRDEAIVRAFGLQKGHRPDILDATAGLGRDGMILAHAGCDVRFLERHPVIHALLSDAVARAGTDDIIGEWVQQRVHVLPAGSLLEDSVAKSLASKPPMAIYLDPMFPHRDKSAAVKKEMQMLQHLVGADTDSDGLLDAARALATHRVVVKRPTKAPFLANQPPHSQVATKKHRFDIYIKQAY